MCVKAAWTLAAAFAALGSVATVDVGCSSKAKLVGQGGECFQATDCVEGLVCVPQTNGARICDNNLTPVQTTEDAAAPRDAGRRDGASADAGPPEGGAPDAQGAEDAASPVDSAPPPADAPPD